eukprot:scaffold191383_cov41-Prasinocladus_malaysianus.AAC.4
MTTITVDPETPFFQKAHSSDHIKVEDEISGGDDDDGNCISDGNTIDSNAKNCAIADDIYDDGHIV